MAPDVARLAADDVNADRLRVAPYGALCAGVVVTAETSDVEGVGESWESKAYKEEDRAYSGVVWGVRGGVGV
jgi:hypothetical protein